MGCRVEVKGHSAGLEEGQKIKEKGEEKYSMSVCVCLRERKCVCVCVCGACEQNLQCLGNMHVLRPGSMLISLAGWFPA